MVNLHIFSIFVALILSYSLCLIWKTIISPLKFLCLSSYSSLLDSKSTSAQRFHELLPDFYVIYMNGWRIIIITIISIVMQNDESKKIREKGRRRKAVIIIGIRRSAWSKNSTIFFALNFQASCTYLKSSFKFYSGFILLGCYIPGQ